MNFNRVSTNMVSTSEVSTNAFFFLSFTDDEDLSTISDDFESMSIQSSTEDSQNEQSCSSRYIHFDSVQFDQICHNHIPYSINV